MDSSSLDAASSLASLASLASLSTALASLTTAPASLPSPTADLPALPADPDAPPHHASPVVAFIIGLAIILLASILNAAGLNLTKLDHVHTSAIPKAARKKDWLRPLWLLGMLLYILSQLIGSTLALEYMRAEYVAPLGSTSLVFNFLFARFLVGTPVTSYDIYGTIVVICGVIGIVAFGSINSGLAAETDVAHITFLWRRSGWLTFFFLMTAALMTLLLFTARLDAVLVARSDINAAPLALPRTRSPSPDPRSRPWSVTRALGGLGHAWTSLNTAITRLLDAWVAPKDDKQVAWTLGIGWACCGGGLAGGCLVFAKATVKLVSGSLSHANPGNQFGHAAPIFTILLLATTAVLQIMCLNRGLRVYDSTLVVPVFYGVYTATGFLDSLIFNDEVDAYRPWTLALIFLSMLVLIAGVVLLTHKKPEPATAPRRAKGAGPAAEPWAVGDASDDEEDAEAGAHALGRLRGAGGSRAALGLAGAPGEEGVRLMDEDARVHASEDFGEWAGATRTVGRGVALP